MISWVPVVLWPKAAAITPALNHRRLGQRESGNGV
jgi:hypothetical protein